MTPRPDSLGSHEQLVLLALARLPRNAYGVTIRHEIHERSGKDVSLGAIYPTLDRLQKKGFVRSYLSEPRGERGGRSRRLYELTPAGAAALISARQQLSSMWLGLRLRVKET